MADINHKRAVALVLKEKVTDLYVAVLPIFAAAAKWNLNSLDAYLPADYTVKVNLDLYEALKIPALRLNDWITELKASLASPDTLYLDPDEPILLDQLHPPIL